MPRSAYSQLKAAISRVVHGEMYYSEFVGYAFQQLSEYVTNVSLKKFLIDKGLKLLIKDADKRLLKYFDGQRFNFDGALLPDVRSNDALISGLSYCSGPQKLDYYHSGRIKIQKRGLLCPKSERSAPSSRPGWYLS